MTLMARAMSDNWRLTLPCSRAEAEALYNLDDVIAALSPAPTIVTHETEAFNDAKWELLAYFKGRPPSATVKRLRAMVPSAANVRGLLERLPDDDWLTLSQQGLQPVKAGRFFVHTHSNAQAAPPDSVAFQIEAGQAFGTGGHETTSGCLTMLDALKRRGMRFDMIADIGTGTGLLAFAARHLWPRAYVTASDIDPVSIDVAKGNAVTNHILLGQYLGQVALCAAPGTAHEMVQRRAPYDLVMANILAGPLIELAPAFYAAMSERGTIVLAGLLNTQADAVIRAYRKLGFRLEGRTDSGDWPCLRFVKRANYAWLRPLRTNSQTSQPDGDFGTW